MSVILDFITGAIYICKVISFTESLNCSKRNFSLLEFFLNHTSQSMFFPNQKTRGWKSMLERKTEHLVAIVFQKQIQPVVMSLHKIQRIGEFGVAISKIGSDNFIQTSWTKNSKWSRAFS